MTEPNSSRFPESHIHSFWEEVTLLISGPSGVGKSTVLKRVLARYEWLQFSISHTTRAMREGEVSGRDYYFVSPEEFEKLRDDDQFIEFAEVHGNMYGTSRSELQRIRSEGKTPLIEVDVQGAISIQQVMEKTLLIMLLPPSFAELRQRLVNRRSESPESLTRRLSRAREEMNLVRDYDFFVVNDDLDETIRVLDAVFTAKAHQMDFIRAEYLNGLVEDDGS